MSLPDESVYVPLGHRPAGGASGALFAPAELNAARAMALLKPLLEDATITKDGHDLNRDLDSWRRVGVNVTGLGLDSRLASYLIDPTGRDHSLVQTARERISCAWRAWRPAVRAPDRQLTRRVRPDECRCRGGSPC